jgi:hypothetical protein
MAFATHDEFLFDALDEDLRVASQPTPELFAKVIAKACSRVPALRSAGRAAGIGRLIESGAWTDSALALAELELPLWKVRRVAYEGGEWFCSLSRAPYLPVEYDDSVDASHAVLPLAILRTVVEARRRTSAERQSAGKSSDALRSVPPLASAFTLCCDNFA